MQHSEYSYRATGAMISKRELRALSKRLATSERPELRGVARALDKVAAGEPYGRRHHDGYYDPARCAACEVDLWVVYAIGVAFPDVSADDLDQFLAGAHGLSRDDIARELENAKEERCPPDVSRAYLALRDRHARELTELRAEYDPNWHRRRTIENPDPDPDDPRLAECFREVRAEHSRELGAFIRAHSPYRWLAPDPALLHEIRFGTDPRKARAVRRASFRKGQGVDPSWLL